MSKIFRHLRKQVLIDRQIGKYLAYAFGEIILVVIGILLAFQINNWNEQRKNSNEELLLLKQLQSDLTFNLEEALDLNERLQINKFGIEGLLNKLHQKEDSRMISVHLGQALRQSDFDYASSGYNLIQNGKAALISTDNVLKSVLDLYESDLTDIEDRQAEMTKSIDYIQRQFINKYFTKSPNDLSLKFKELDLVTTELFEPVNFNTLTENIEFTNSLLQLGKLVETRLAHLENIESKLQKTIVLIDSQLD